MRSYRLRFLISIWLAFITVAPALKAAAPAAETFKAIELWPEGAPGAVGKEDIDKPSITIFLPPKGKANGAGVVICPGGAYRILAFDHEGVQVAQWLNSIGVAGFVLKYRLGPRYHHPAPMQDVQRAIRYVRDHAKEYGISPQRLGVMGFSAGGHLAATAATHFDDGNPAATDEIDRQSCRPGFAVLCYGVISMQEKLGHKFSEKMLLGDNPNPKLVQSLSNEREVSEKTPPTFLFHTAEDTSVPPDNSIAFYQACRAKGVEAELHIFGYGAHGLGMATGDPATAKWPELLAGWLRKSGLLTDAPRMAISGTVTVDGKPLNRGWITFFPQNSDAKPIAAAYISNEGKYKIDAKTGPCEGPCRVEVRQVANALLQAPSIDGEKLFTSEKPKGKPLVYRVQSGANTFDVNIATKK